MKRSTLTSLAFAAVTASVSAPQALADVTSEEERKEKLLQRMHQIVTTTMNDETALDNKLWTDPWTEQAQKDSNSPAGQLSSMVSPKTRCLIWRMGQGWR